MNRMALEWLLEGFDLWAHRQHSFEVSIDHEESEAKACPETTSWFNFFLTKTKCYHLVENNYRDDM